VRELESAAKGGERAGLTWLGGLEEDQQSFYVDLVLGSPSYEGGVPEGQRAPSLPAIEVPGVGALSPAATHLLWDYAAAVVAEWTAWDRQMEEDATAGRLGKVKEMGAQALRDHAAGFTKPL